MIKCLECGFESSRLQWTHFKYNCTGRFANGREYKKSYPGAKIVDDALAKTTAVTLANLINKHGKTEGQKRWDAYRQKQAETNSFEYKQEKHGWSKDEFNAYNSSRAQTLEKMIARHGEIDGAAKWEQYCLRQAYTNTKEYFVGKYGVNIGMQRYLEVNQKKSIPHNPVLLADHLAIDIDTATQIIISRQKNFYVSQAEIEFTKMLEEKIGRLDHTSFNNPYGKWSHLLNTYVVYDIKHKNCIIEFNGNYWHANPSIYADTAIIRGMSAIDIRQRDMLKLKTASDLGYSVFTVWEDEFINDKNETIKKVEQWILQEQRLKA